MKRNTLKSKPIPRWLSIGLERKDFSATEVAREMRARGCKMPLTTFSQKSNIAYTWKFDKEEIEVLKIVRKLVINRKINQLKELL